MKRFLTTAATALVLSTAAYAENHLAQVGAYEVDAKSDLYASELIGMRVYASEQAMEGDTIEAGAQGEWDDIGEINDIIVSKDGKLQAVILGVGGFLGIGEKDVAVTMQDIKIVNEKDSDDYFLVVSTNKASLEQAPAFERAERNMEQAAERTGEATATAVANVGQETEQAAANVEQETEQAAANVEQETEQAAAEVEQETEEAVAATDAEINDQERVADEERMRDESGRVMLRQPEVEREGFQATTASEIDTDKLDGAPVYGINDETVGEIDKVILTQDGQAERAVINVGGFLGIGEKPVAVTFKELRILREADGDDLRIYIDASEDELKNQPEYEENN